MLRQLSCLVVALWLCACARPHPRHAQPARPSWIEVQSPHFVVRCAAGERTARDTAASLELVWHVLAAAFPEEAPPGRVFVVVYAEPAAYRAIAPPGSQGFFTTGPLEWLPEPTISFVADEYATAQPLLAHELTHRFVAFHYPAAPIWLNEGLATYFESLHLESRGRWLKAVYGDARGLVGALPPTDLPRRQELFALDQDAFYGDTPGITEAERKRRRALNYAAAGALIQTLRTGSLPVKRAFVALLNDLRSGVAEPERAWALRFGEHKTREVDAAYEALLTHHRGRSEAFVVPRPRRLALASRRLPEVEALLFEARQRDWDEADDGSFAQRHLDAALALAPSSAAAHRARGHWAIRRHDAPLHGGSPPDGGTWLELAEREFERAVELAPQDSESLHALARLVLQRARQASSPPLERRLDELAARLARHPSAALHHELLATWHARRRRPNEAAAAITAAIAADSSCARCYATAAEQLHAAGNTKLARVAERSAFAALPDGANPDRAFGDYAWYQAREHQLAARERQVAAQEPPRPCLCTQLAPEACPAEARLEPQPDGEREPHPTLIPPRPLDMPPPAYPRALRNAGVEGEVALRYIVDEQGRVPGAKRLCGPVELGAVVWETMRTWRFVPATTSAGQPISVTRIYRFHFKITSDPPAPSSPTPPVGEDRADPADPALSE